MIDADLMRGQTPMRIIDARSVRGVKDDRQRAGSRLLIDLIRRRIKCGAGADALSRRIDTLLRPSRLDQRLEAELRAHGIPVRIDMAVDGDGVMSLKRIEQPFCVKLHAFSVTN